MGDGLLSVAAHTIGHRTVEINDIETNNNNLIGEIENVGDNSGIVSAIGLHSGTSSGSDIGMAASDLRYSLSSLTSDSGENEAEVIDGRQLVVVSVRGSVTMLDWLTELLKNGIITQVIFHLSSVFKNFISSFKFWKTDLLIQRFCRKTKHFC